MRILAIETSAQVASAAVVNSDGIMGELTLNTGLTHSQNLMPGIDALLKQLSLKMNDIDGIAVASGPGSFTGVRIGMATAKGLAHGAEIPVYTVSTLEGLAWNLAGVTQLVCPIMDARRDQVYTALFDCQAEVPQRVAEDSARSIDDLIVTLKEHQRPVCFVGDGVKRFREHIISVLGDNARFPQKHLLAQRAASIGMVALAGTNGTNVQEYSKATAKYLRPSQAERMRGEKNGA